MLIVCTVYSFAFSCDFISFYILAFRLYVAFFLDVYDVYNK